MAGGLASKIAAARSVDLEVRTAGIAHHPGRPVEPKAVSVLSELGVDISHEYSKPVTCEDIDWADVIVPVQQEHAAHLEDRYARAAGKIRRLARDVADPYGKCVATYRDCRDDLEDLLLRLPIWRDTAKAPG